MYNSKKFKEQVISYNDEEIVIKSSLDKGGNSKVFICNYRGKSYVIKFFKGKKKRYKRFQQEVEKIREINKKIASFTPNVIASKIPKAYKQKGPSKGNIDFNNTPFYIMEQGKKYDYSGKSFPNKLNDILEICMSLKQLHNNDIQHRDIKPDNIVNYNGRLTFIDFGTAKVPGIKTVDESEFMGSRGTMAPEMISHAKDLSGYRYEYADIYSLGKTIWIILTEDRRADKFTTYEYTNVYSNINIPNVNEGIILILEQIIHKSTLENYIDRISLDEIIEKIKYIKNVLLHNTEKCNFIKYEYLLKSIHDPRFDAIVIKDLDKQLKFIDKIQNVGVNVRLQKGNLSCISKIISNFRISYKENTYYSLESNEIKFIFQIEFIVIKKDEVIIYNKKDISPELEPITPLSTISNIAFQTILSNPTEDIENKIYLDCEISLNVVRQLI